MKGYYDNNSSFSCRTLLLSGSYFLIIRPFFIYCYSNWIILLYLTNFVVFYDLSSKDINKIRQFPQKYSINMFCNDKIRKRKVYKTMILHFLINPYISLSRITSENKHIRITTINTKILLFRRY